MLLRRPPPRPPPDRPVPLRSPAQCLKVNEELIRHAQLDKVASVKPAAAKQAVAA